MGWHWGKGQRGWTLIELAAVLAVTGVLASMVWPMFDGLVSRLVLRSTSMTVIETLRTVRHRAMAEGRSYEVVFDAVAGECRVQGAGGGASLVVALPARVRFGAAAGVLGPPSAPAKPPPTGGVTFQQAKVKFLPDGTLSPGPGTIYLTGRAGRGGESAATVAISVNIAGHLRRYRWEEQAWRMM
ncbi:MAG: prepilin-type N-terminal cleavage/methylation domain-containing protein [Nitrospirae bacterium]|nr:prepilin-type N-terminal cleavage/methylation domain-containing protein [Nitrospirota bacterium]